MKLLHALCGAAATLALLPAGALAQEDPEAVYARLHRASLAGNSDEVISFASARMKADLASKSKAEKDGVIQILAKLMPKTYLITGKTIAPDGNSAVLRGSGVSEFMGAKSQMYLNASFLKEGGAWKVDQWAWTNDKPAASAKPEPRPEVKMAEPKPEPKAAPTPAAPAKMEKEAVRQSEARAPAKATGTGKPSRSSENAQECLKLSTNAEIARCAGKYR